MCDESTVPLTVFALDHPEPAEGWRRLFEAEGVEQVEDHIGRPAISCEDAGRLLGVLRAQADERRRRHAEQERKSAEFAARYPVPAGIPVGGAGNAVLDLLTAGGDMPEPVLGAAFGETAVERAHSSSSTRRERWIQDGPVGRWVPDEE